MGPCTGPIPFSKEANTNENPTMIDTKKIASLLGDQVKFISTKTSNVHDKEDGKLLDPQAAEWALKENKTHSNAKIPVNTAPKGKVWVVIDYDDHKDDGKLDTIREDFNLPKTFTVKTPSGKGKHEWYLLDEETAARLPKWKYVIPKFQHTDILIGHKSLKQAFVAPGSKKENGEYQLTNNVQPADLPDMVLQTLLAQARSESNELSKSLEDNRISFNSDIDSGENKGQYLDYIAQVTRPYELGDRPPLEEGDGRNNILFGWACQGFTYNLSYDAVIDLLQHKINYNKSVMLEPLPDEEVEISVRSAFKMVTDERRNSERATNTELTPYEFDSKGNRKISYEQHTKKVLYLWSHSNYAICTNENLRKLLCETIVYDRKSGDYFVARIKSYKEYEKTYNRQMYEEEAKKIIDLDGILSLYAETILHWDRMTERQLNTEFSYLNGKQLKKITSWHEFKVYSFNCNVYTRSYDPTVLIEDDAFFLIDRSPIKPYAKEDVTEKDRKKVAELLNTHMRRIVDPNHFERESSWLLDRYSYMLQNLDERTENVLIIKGPQGTGKSVFATIMRHLFPPSKSIIYTDIAVMTSNFTEYRHDTYLDDVNLSRYGNDIENKIKSMTSSSQVMFEAKYEQRKVSFGSINITMSTNNDIDVNEFLTGRRFTVLENNEIISIDEVAKSVHDALITLKKDNFHLYRVLATMMMERDVTFRSNFKTAVQKEKQALSNKGNKFGIALANMIANYGYISPSCQPIVPNENFNRNDFVTALFFHWYKLESNKLDVKDQKDLRRPDDVRIDRYFSPDQQKNASIKAVFKELFTDPNTRISSQINTAIGQQWCYTAPSMQDWIRLLAYATLNDKDKDSISYTIERYGFEAQWDWDEKTKPDVENLGSINVFDNIDSFLTDDDDSMSPLDSI